MPNIHSQRRVPNAKSRQLLVGWCPGVVIVDILGTSVLPPYSGLINHPGVVPLVISADVRRLCRDIGGYYGVAGQMLADPGMPRAVYVSLEGHFA